MTKDLGGLNYFLGIEVTHILDGVILPQRRYVMDLECLAVSLPLFP